jgi:uncharacterized protein
MLAPFAARRAVMRKALWSKHSWIRTACLTICLLAAGPAGAQSPSPEAMAAARELIVTMRAADYFKTLMPAIMQQLKPAIVQNRPQVERDYDAIVPLLLDSMNARVNEIIDQIAALYARNFSVEELREVVAFYRGPTGQKFVQKLPLITQESMVIGQRFGQSIGAEIHGRIVEELRKRGHNI